MINNTIAFPLAKAAHKSFTPISHPEKITIQRIFYNHWNDFKNDNEVIKRGIRPIVNEEVEKNGGAALNAISLMLSAIPVRVDSVTPVESKLLKFVPSTYPMPL